MNMLEFPVEPNLFDRWKAVGVGPMRFGDLPFPNGLYPSERRHKPDSIIRVYPSPVDFTILIQREADLWAFGYSKDSAAGMQLKEAEIGLWNNIAIGTSMSILLHIIEAWESDQASRRKTSTPPARR